VNPATPLPEPPPVVPVPPLPLVLPLLQALDSAAEFDTDPFVPQSVADTTGVQVSVSGGAVSGQLLLSTVVPSLRVQAIVWVAFPESASGTQVAVRLWEMSPQPVLGVQGLYCHAPVPAVHVPKPLGVQAKVQVLKSASVCKVAGLVPTLEHRPSATVLPSDWVQVTLRV
jgi:hypothetical protein